MIKPISKEDMEKYLAEEYGIRTAKELYEAILSHGIINVGIMTKKGDEQDD